jgi:hypothetical protein
LRLNRLASPAPGHELIIVRRGSLSKRRTNC